MPPLPRILVRNGVVTAGDLVLQPSRKDWRRRLCHWRAVRAGRAVTGWYMTPSLALRAALK